MKLERVLAKVERTVRRMKMKFVPACVATATTYRGRHHRKASTCSPRFIMVKRYINAASNMVNGTSFLSEKHSQFFTAMQAPAGSWPWQVLITIKLSFTGRQNCGGSIVRLTNQPTSSASLTTSSILLTSMFWLFRSEACGF